MVGIISKPGTQEKLEILSADAQYDLACACSTSKDEHRRRTEDGKWIYPVTLPNGGKSVLFKTLTSNVCTNDCKYCPLREQMDVRRVSLAPEETAKVFLDYLNQRKVFGLFLSSGVTGSADTTMDKLNGVARLLRRKHRFKGYIHLKIIPGASDAAVEEAVCESAGIEIEGRRALLEELALLGEEEGEAGEVDLLIVRLHLGEVGVDREVQGQIGCRRVLEVDPGFPRRIVHRRPPCRSSDRRTELGRLAKPTEGVGCHVERLRLPHSSERDPLGLGRLGEPQPPPLRVDGGE